MYKFEIIEPNDPKWEKTVHASFTHDFAHTAYNHQIDNNYQSLLFIAEDLHNFVALPLVIRPIDKTVWRDATSVYGYCGPLSNVENFDVSSELILFFRARFLEYCRNNSIVSVFSRLHPLIHQAPFFSNFGKVVPLNKTIAIDLRLPLEAQKQQYRKSNKSELNQLRRKGFYVEEAKSPGDIERFIEIYYETMKRVGATPYYYFTKDYFHSFLANIHFGKILLVAKFEGEIIAGAIFTTTDKIMQYHLAGTTEEYIRLTPMKLVLDEARLLGHSLGLEFLHLGGGVAGSDDDSLFRFKAGFSDHRCQFTTWQFIADQDKYNALVQNITVDMESSYFPLYRAI